MQNRNRHTTDLKVDRFITTLNIYGDQKSETQNPGDPLQGALVVHNGDVGMNENLNVRKTVSADKFYGEIAQIFTEFQLQNGSQAEAYVLTGDANGVGNWVTPHWFTNDPVVVREGPTDNHIWTVHNVGINTTLPQERFHVYTETANEGARIGNINLNVWGENTNSGVLTHVSLKGDTDAYSLKTIDSGETHLNAKNRTEMRINDIMAVTLDSNRYMGIGITAPEEMLHVAENVVINGNLEVRGSTTTVSTETLTIQDPLIKLSTDNIGDSTDIGWYGMYVDNGVTKFTGVYRDASEDDRLFKMFHNLETEPTLSLVGDPELAKLRINGLEVELGVTFDPSSRLRHNELIISGGVEPTYIDHIWIKNDGKVGIYTDNPNVALEVIGEASVSEKIGIGITLPNYTIDTDYTDAFRLPTGNTAQRPVGIEGLIRYNQEKQIYEGYFEDGWGTVGIVIDQDLDTFIDPELGQDDDHLRFFTFGEERITITNTGDIGVGVSFPNIKFQIEGVDAIKIPQGNTSQRPITEEDGQVRYNNEKQIYEAYSTKYNQWESLSHPRDGDEDTYITTEESVDEDRIRFYVGGSQRMIIHDDNKIGIGVTVDPKYAIDIRDDGAMLLPVGDTATRPAPPEYGLIRYNPEREVFEGYGVNKQWNILQDGLKDADGDTSITPEKFLDEDRLRFTTDGIQRMTIEPDGLIGIGISTPEYEVDMAGTFRADNIILNNDLTVNGNLTVNGTTVTANTEVLEVEDPMIKLALNNPSDTLDIGFYGLYDGLGVTKYTGLVRDVTDGYYKLFDSLTIEPTTEVDFGVTSGLNRANLELNILDGNYIDFPNSDFRIRSSAGSVDRVIITDDPYVGINTDPNYPLHITTSNPASWSARLTNDVGSDVFIANTEGQGMMINTKVASSNGNYAVQVRNTTFSSSNALMEIKNSGRVGFSTSTPDNKMHIETSTAGEGLHVGNAFIGIWDDSTTFMSMGHDTPDGKGYAVKQSSVGKTVINAALGEDISFAIDDVELIFVDPSGNFGIGVTNPTEKLDVDGTTYIDGDTGDWALKIDNDSTSVDIAHSDGSGILIDSATSYAIKATNGVTNNFVVTNDGRVGINTDNPDEKFHISTTTAGDSALIGNAQIGIYETDNTFTAYAHGDMYENNKSYAIKQNNVGETHLNAALDQDIIFSINDDQRMIIDQDGNIGIGVTVPTAGTRLEVLGNSKFDGDVLITGELTFDGPFVESLVFQDSLIKLAGDNTTDVIDIGFYGRYQQLGDDKFTGLFWDASTEKYRLFDSLEVEPNVVVGITEATYNESELVLGDLYVINNVGIGTETPTTKLDVNGVVRAQNYITTSDERAKNIERKIEEEESYNNIRKAEVYKYKMKNGDDKDHIGFIAQQMEKVLPESVINTNRELGIDQYSILASLTNAFKFMANKMEALEDRVETLELENSELKDEIFRLKVRDILDFD